jgi:hypothetical protein
MIIFLLIIWALIIISLIYCNYLLKRNNRVRAFLLMILDLNNQVDIELIKDGKESTDLRIVKEITEKYNKVLYSFKPLKIKYWFNNEDLKILESAQEIVELNRIKTLN